MHDMGVGLLGTMVASVVFAHEAKLGAGAVDLDEDDLSPTAAAADRFGGRFSRPDIFGRCYAGQYVDTIIMAYFVVAEGVIPASRIALGEIGGAAANEKGQRQSGRDDGSSFPHSREGV